MLEKNVMKLVMLRVSELGAVIFRQNVGQAWQGGIVRTAHGKPDTVVLQGARRLTMGLCPGSSDLIGWRKTLITPEMVGSHVAVFLAIESKRTKGGRLSASQKRFIDRVNADGGIAGVARSPEEAERLLSVNP